MIFYRSLCEDLDEVLVKSFLRGHCMILYRSFTEGLVEILVRSFLRGPCMKTLQMPCLTGACMKALVGGSSSCRSFCHDLARFSWGSWHEDLGQGLSQFLVSRSCRDPGETL